MRKSKMLAKLRRGEFARVCGMGHIIPFYVRYAAKFHYDGIWLDLEHRSMGAQDVRYLLALCHYNDIDCMVRPPTLERTRLYRYLEDGATGFMVPFVSSAEDARHVVRCVKFPPLGNRGVDGAGLDADYGLEAWRPNSTYTEDANRETFLIAQIETPEALANVGEIAAVQGIDCVFVGPADLGLRLSLVENAGGIPLEEAVSKVAAAARRHHKAWGRTAGSLEAVKQYAAMGAQIVPWGSDFSLSKILEDRSQELDAVLSKTSS